MSVEDVPDVRPGRARAGLEQWLFEITDVLPAALTEAARVLADEVDRSPSDSPLWGRYTALLALLVDEWRASLDRGDPAFEELMAALWAEREETP